MDALRVALTKSTTQLIRKILLEKRKGLVERLSQPKQVTHDYHRRQMLKSNKPR